VGSAAITDSGRVLIEMDPHKRSATIEVMTGAEDDVGGGRFGTDHDGYAAMLRYGRQWSDRSGRSRAAPASGSTSRTGCWPTANRSSTCGEAVCADPGVPDRAGPQDRRHRHPLGRAGGHPDERLRPMVNDGQLAVLRILADRRRSLGEQHPRMVSATACRGREPADQPGAAHHGPRPPATPARAAPTTTARRPTARRPAIRCVKRRLSDIVYQPMLHDAIARTATKKATGWEGNRETTLTPARPAHIPTSGSSDKPLPGPATNQPKTPLRKAG
jgi:hypothetical protein